MIVKLFVLGLPGSGKSTVTHYISTYARGRRWSITHINDYGILYRMFQEDTKGQFKPTNFGGFDVLDFTVFDTALKKLEQEANRHSSSSKSEDVILIEFARNDYQEAFQQFNQEFLKDAYFLFLDVNVETCKRRIRERIAHPNTGDDFFVSEYIFSTYYNKNIGNGQYISQILERNYGIDKQRVEVIDNSGSLQNSTAWINRFLDSIFKLEAHRLRHTDPIQRVPNVVSDGELKSK